MREHTKEPWNVGVVLVSGYNATAILDCDGDEVCNMGTSLLNEDANATRIVACVNACAGIPTEALERGDLELLLLSTHEAHAAKLRRERDEAVEALKLMLRRHGCVEGCCASARAVLAKIGGQG